MRISILLAICLWLASACFAATTIQGTIFDPSDAAIPGAQVAAVNRVGVVAQTTSNAVGAFELKLPELATARLVITAAGFETRTIPLDPASAAQPLTVRLNIAPQVDTVRVAGSTIDVPVSEQGSSISVIPQEEIRGRNEAQALELLRYLPSLAVSQNGGLGGVTGVFIRGGNSNFNLVEIDGVPINSFGGAFDFAHIPTDWLDRIEVIRGPQSAVYGPYANSGMIQFVSRSAENSPNFDALAEGGTYRERRFALGSAGRVKDFGFAAFASRLDSDGPVENSDYRNANLALHVTRSFGRQNLALSGNFNSNEGGAPGPYGSNPKNLFTGIDGVSRDKNNFSQYLVRHQIDFSDRMRQETFASFFLNNSGFQSPFGFSFNKDLRGQAETRTVVSVTHAYTVALGATFAREEVKNTFISDNSFRAFPLRRDYESIYWENRFQFGRRLFWNAGLRGEMIRTPVIPANSAFSRPEFPDHTLFKANPKIAAAYALRPDRNGMLGTARLHSSFGTGIRPPSGFDLAFTNNPTLKPERTTSFDAGIEQRLFGNRLSADGTYFYSRFYDLIVSLGGSLARLSSYQSDNLANSRAQGVEFSARLRPVRRVSVAGSYTYLKSEILSLNGAGGVAPRFFQVRQELLRRPAHSGAIVSTLVYKKLSANVTGYFRGPVLDVEPNFGASEGLFRNPGFADLGINLNYRIAPGVTIYGNLRNALNQRYEETFGFPSPRLNFVTGMKWTLSRAR